MRKVKFLFLILAILFVASCSNLKGGLRGVPRPIGDQYYQELAKRYEKSSFRAEYDKLDPLKTPEDRKAERNKILNELILLMDVLHRDYEDFLYVGKAAADTVFDVTELGLTLWATATGVVSLKTTLSAIATGLQGTKLAIDKNLLQTKTIIALISKMRSLRKTKLVVLLRGMEKSDQEYNLDQGLIDIGGYYDAGTLIGALHDIFEKSGEEGRTAEEEIKMLKR